MVGAADLTLHPIALVALPCTVGGHRHAQGGQCQLVVVLCGRVVEQAVAVIVVVPQVGAVAVAAVPQGIVVVWHSPADQRRSRPGLRQRRTGSQCSRRKGHRKTLAKIPSFHGFILSHPPLRPVHRRLFYSIILFAAGCNFYLRRQTGQFEMPSACALGIISGIGFFIRDSEKPAGFSESPFHGRDWERTPSVKAYRL